MEQSQSVRPAANACDKLVGQPACALQQLRSRLCADHALEIADHFRIGMRASSRANDVECVVHIGDPIAKAFVHGVFQRRPAAGYRHNFCAQ